MQRSRALHNKSQLSTRNSLSVASRAKLFIVPLLAQIRFIWIASIGRTVRANALHGIKVGRASKERLAALVYPGCEPFLSSDCAIKPFHACHVTHVPLPIVYHVAGRSSYALVLRKHRVKRLYQLLYTPSRARSWLRLYPPCLIYRSSFSLCSITRCPTG